MIIGLLNQGFSEIEVRSVLKGLGGYRFTRVKKEMNVPELKECKRKPRRAFNEGALNNVMKLGSMKIDFHVLIVDQESGL